VVAYNLYTDAENTVRISSMLEELNHTMPEIFEDCSEGEMNYECFSRILLGKSLGDVSETTFTMAQEICTACVQDTAMNIIAKETHVTQQHINQNSVGGVNDRRWWLELLVACVIFLNALAIGLSQDIYSESASWSILEVLFTAFFVVELLVKVCRHGLFNHFFGWDWKWNLFDFVVVSTAVVDLAVVILTALGLWSIGSSDLNRITVMRIARLVRITRLMRLLRMRAFKELLLMVNGIIGGLRTLFWAFILLSCIVYIQGVLLNQLMKDWKLRLEEGGFRLTASDSNVYDHYELLFSNLFRSCLTILRCYLGDCSFPNGTPIIPHFLAVHGPFVIIFYVASNLFVLFGVFNLIMAVFVENTLEAAKTNQQRRHNLRYKEHVRLAQKLQQLVHKLCGGESEKEPGVASEPKGLWNRWRYVLRAFTGSSSLAIKASFPGRLHLAIAKPDFERAMAGDEAQEMLDELEVSLSNRSKLFDILDSNGNGSLDLSEVVEGIMKLRGPADKGDIVCTSLMLRSLQKNFLSVKVAIRTNTAQLERTEAKLRNLEALLEQRGAEGFFPGPHHKLAGLSHEASRPSS